MSGRECVAAADRLPRNSCWRGDRHHRASEGLDVKWPGSQRHDASAYRSPLFGAPFESAEDDSQAMRTAVTCALGAGQRELQSVTRFLARRRAEPIPSGSRLRGPRASSRADRPGRCVLALFSPARSHRWMITCLGAASRILVPQLGRGRVRAGATISWLRRAAGGSDH